ncbi:hypothetical protein Tdes44962_MAKER10026 [Teratosphaeria destructans]|uniref:Uncharacterized protein n=1 Tax=Teratosphaeria destructans TaxID=418781 RepID=A0A9W7SQ58_9PEZI|nr:hypothetical protein Tdes44962_MAKER10026 [Teratosphaeria destructans]
MRGRTRPAASTTITRTTLYLYVCRSRTPLLATATPPPLDEADQILNHALEGLLLLDHLVPPHQPILQHGAGVAVQHLQARHVRLQFLVYEARQGLHRRGAQESRGVEIEVRRRRGAFRETSGGRPFLAGFGVEGGRAGVGGGVFEAVEGVGGAGGGGEAGGGEDEAFLLAGGQDFVEVDGHAQADEEEASDAAAGPIGGLQRRWGDELLPEGEGAGGEEGGGFGGFDGREGWEGWERLGGGEDGGDVGRDGFLGFGGGEVGEV